MPVANCVDLDTMPKFEKSFYKPSDTVRSRSEREVEDFRRDKQIKVQGTTIPKPVTSFDEAGFPGK